MTIASSSPSHDGPIHQQRPQQQQHSSPFIPPPSSYPLRDDSLLSSAFQIPWSPSMMNSNEPFLSTSSSDPKATNDQGRPQKVVAPAESLSSNSTMLQQEFSRQPHVLLSQRETVQQPQQHHRNAPQQQTEILNMVPLAGNASESPNRDRTIPERQQRQEYAINVIGYQNQSWEHSSSAPTATRNSPANDTRFNYDQRNQQNSSKTPVLQSSQHNNNESSNHITPNTSMFTSFGNGEQPYSSQMVTSTSAPAAPWTTTTLWSGNGTTDTPYSSSPQTTHHSHQYLSPASEPQQTTSMNSINDNSFSLDFLAPPPSDSLQQKKHSHSTLVNGYSSGSSTTTATSSDRRNPVTSGMNSSSFEIFDSTFLNNSNNRNNEDNNSNGSTGNKYVSGPFSEDLMPVRAIPMSNVKAGVRTARMLIDATVAMKTRPQIQSYLLAADPVAMGERTVVILTGKVAQKSYGTEKRFLCPPPTVILDGASWWTKKHDDPSTTAPPQLMVSMSGETSETQEGQIDWFSVSGTTVGQTGYGSNNNNTNNAGRIRASFDKGSSSDRDWYRIQPRDPLAGGKCVLRQLYINDADDKRKRVECLARLQLADGTPIGTLASKPVKVISKPSKKRLSVKNMDSCIHHGTTVSLFNRIRSQTVSTKYLGVSASAGATSTTQPFMYPGQAKANHNLDGPASTSSPDGTCFIARTGSWDPFIIWLVDTTWVPQHHERESNSPDEYIGSGASTLRNDIPYPPPPAIAAKNKTGQPLAVHYNQHIVLQCLTTGLVSPVMIIRKIDRASTVVGGANSKYYSHYRSTEPSPSGTSGGEYGDEILGDPVSQLHKVALQIVQDPSSRLQENDIPLQNDMLPRVNRPVTYLACLNDMVGMHRSAHERKPIRPEPATNIDSDSASSRAATRRRIASTGNVSDYYYGINPPTQQSQQPSQSMYSTINFQGASEEYHQQHPQQQMVGKRSRSVSAIDQGNDDMPALNASWSELGAYWSEDVSDSAVWTIVGTDCAKYTFWELPPVAEEEEEFVDERFLDMSLKINTPRTVTIAPVPTLVRFSRTKGDNDGLFLSMHGESFTRDLEVWFGDVRSPRSEYRGREHMVCEVPIASELAHSVGAEWKNGGSCSVPLLLVRRNGSAVYKTNKYYTFC
ncbi:hypothetical protein BJV82DRAFT_583229 [Fennellomyces sp. T-0311]|nr:hypothetical protein BJV82DRAFT_583229 [Fennellomyces sp. T-0311]